jgi:N-methylhydantoinase A/oxoprolinase/acetone carboxylase beta subunit
MVEAVDVHTVGLGGDSRVKVNGRHTSSQSWLEIGPRRVIPLCLLANQYPEVKAELRRQVTENNTDSLAGQFVLVQRKATHALSDSDREFLDYLGKGPVSLIELTSKMRYSFLLSRQIESLAARRLVLLAGFTPTDALHVLKQFRYWDDEASHLGAELLAQQANLPIEAFCNGVVSGVSNRVATELVSKVLSDEGTSPDWIGEPTATALLSRALNGSHDLKLDCQLTLKQPVIAIGAPVGAYLPRSSELLHTDLVIPNHAGVANALGAVAGGVVQQMRVLIHLLEEEALLYRVHMSDGIRDFATLEESVAYAQNVVPEQLRSLAQKAGAEQVEVKVVREDRTAPVKGGWGSEIYLGTELVFTAVGRPSLAK